MPKSVARVLFPVSVPEPFDYLAPAGTPVRIGDFVYAPIGKQVKLGVVWGFGETDPDRDLKSIAERKSCRPLSPEMLKFVDFTAKYNCAPLGMVLRMVIRSYKALDPSPMVDFYTPKGDRPAGLTPARQRVLDLADVWPGRASDIAKAAGVSPGVISGMAKAGLLTRTHAPLDPPFVQPRPAHDGRAFELTSGQNQAVLSLSKLVEETGFNAALLDGVTGSGKTEVYLEAAAKALEHGGQVLILVPEIALTQAGMRRITERFGAEPAQWHSAMGDAARRRVWREVATGRAKLVVGARSALYLPYTDLQLIVVDEEHDSSYKQEEGVIYNARDMAVVRASLSGASIVLASATPSLESLTNARTGRYAHVILPERPGAAIMPEVGLVDLKEHVPEKGRFLSQPLIDGVSQALEQGDQAMLYLNRRGYAPLIICRACGERLKSPDTDSWLVEHKRTGRAICHHTGYSMPMPKACPACKTDGSLSPVGPGVERVAEEAAILFPDKTIEILSSDTAGNPERIRERMAKMAAGEIDIMVGTQMVVKGHNFPHLTFVGVVDGDLGLAGGDLRAGERTYQTLVQVAGRAGRAEKPGRALIQTHLPEHEALVALANGDREAFIKAELGMREMLGLPPFGKLAAVIISGPDAPKANEFAQKFLKLAPRVGIDGGDIEIMGPSEAPIAILRGRHRRRFLIRADRNINLPAYMRTWQGRIRVPSKFKLQIDIDPQGFM
ncbi:MAG: primosomal protein N' [Hyphomonadaceae bacterium]|nr:primosomal protein N' [Hyphomonadaceae bacterium]